PEPTLNPKPHPNPKAKTVDKRPCNLCQKSLKGKEGLKKHQKDVHGKVAKLKCGACEMLFFSGPDLEAHKQKKTSEVRVY
ncbi:unnamed protein product, partial [Prunus brigantina]